MPRNFRLQFVVLAAGVLILVAATAGASRAARSTFTIQLLDTGPNPSTLTVAMGDVVTFTNAGAENHDIVSTSANYTAPLLRPGQSASLTMNTAGRFPYVETGFTHPHRGVIVVTAVAAGQTGLSLQGHPLSVLFGTRAILTGSSAMPPGTAVVLVAHPGSRASKRCASKTKKATAQPSGWTPVGAPSQVGPTSSYTFAVTPAAATTYRVQSSDGTVCSALVTVHVRPRVTMRLARTKVKTGQPVAIGAAVQPAAAGKTLVLYALTKKSPTWRKVATAQGSTAGTARFVFTAPQGSTRLRVSTSAKGTGRGAYMIGTSVPHVLTGLGAPPARSHRSKKK